MKTAVGTAGIVKKIVKECYISLNQFCLLTFLLASVDTWSSWNVHFNRESCRNRIYICKDFRHIKRHLTITLSAEYDRVPVQFLAKCNVLLIDSALEIFHCRATVILKKSKSYLRFLSRRTFTRSWITLDCVDIGIYFLGKQWYIFATLSEIYANSVQVTNILV